MKWRIGLVVCIVLSVLALPVLGEVPKVSKVEVVSELKHDLSPPLREMIPPAGYKPLPKHEECNPPEERRHESVVQFWEDPVVQTQTRTEAMPAITQWEGLSAAQSGGYFPPDTEGDVGLNHYVQWVNVYMQIWDKSGTSVWGPHPGNYIWNGFGGPCDSCNDGDPIVLYDRLSDRWLISQFALPNYPSGPFYQYIAISQTGDPTGSWYRYAFAVHATKMNDYPKFGIWSDGYYMTAHLFGSGGMGVYVFDKAKMMAGLAATFQYFDLEGTKPFWGMLPASYEGTTPPPAGAPCPFAEVDDSTDIGPVDAMRIWNFHVDWTTPANTTFGLAGDPNWVLPVAAFTPFCLSGQCIQQPGTAQGLDDLADRLMYKLIYRNFGGYQAMVLNHTVDAGSARAGVRWYEVRNDGTNWSIYQQGTFAPSDTEHRWMGSIGFDHMGNIAMGYSVSSSTVYPSIRIAGRLTGDTLGTMGQGESSMMVGTGSQTGSDSYGRGRWGDYSTISADPSDDCTFWYTTEYMQTTSGAGWQTRIGHFKFPGCSIGPTGTLSGTVRDSATTLPIASANVSATNGTITQNVTTGPAGTYTMTLPISPPNYDVTASAFGFAPVTVNGVVINNGATTTQDFNLTGASMYTVSGTVTDVNTGWGLYANVAISASGWAGATVATDPTTGAYSINLVGGATYSFTVTSMVPGYNVGTATLGPLAGPATQNFALTVNACGAPGYSNSGGLSESFTGTTTPVGWTVVNNAGTCVWRFDNPGARSNMTGGTGNFAVADSDNCGSGSTMNTELRTPVMNFTGVASVPLSFKSEYNNLVTGESADVDVSVNGAAGPWTNVWHQNTDQRGPMTVNLDLSAIAGNQANVMVRFHYIAPGWDWWWEVDDVVLGTPTCNTPPGGLIVGFVKDAATTNPIAAASVANATTAFTGLSDTAGFYAVYAAAGTNNLTASKALYQNGTASPTGVAHATVRQDFNLSSSSTYTLSGVVTDSPGGWPLYAQLTFTAAGFPTVNATTDPVTGAYSASIFGGTVYTVAGTALVPGYSPLATTVGPIAGNTTQNFQIAATCGAPGYTVAPVFSENFDGVTPPALPAGWAVSSASPTWASNAGRAHPSGTAYSAPNVMRFNSWTVSSGSCRLYRTTGLNLSAVGNPTLTFYMFHDTGFSSANDRIQVQVSTDAGVTWQNVGSPISRYLASSNVWTQHSLSLTGFTGALTDVRIGFNATSAYGNDCYIDSVAVVGCSAGAGGLIVGTVRDGGTSNLLVGAVVNNTTTSSSDTTDAAGIYTVYGAVGANSVTASFPTYVPLTATVTGLAHANALHDFNLTPAPLITLSGTVKDSVTGWPLYAQLTFSGTGYPTVSTWTNPVTGAYTVSIYSYAVYNVAGTAWVAGYTPLATTTGPYTGNSTANFTMVPSGGCSAPGYTAPSLLTENFDGVTAPALPAGWAMVRTGGATTTTAWTTNAGRTHPAGSSYSAPNVARFNSYDVTSGNAARLYRTSGLNLTAYPGALLSFYMFHDTGYTSADTVQVQVSTDGGTTWQPVGAAIPRYIAGVNAWQQHVVTLTGFTGPVTDVRLGFNATSAYGNDCYIDDVAVKGACSPPAGGGLIVGNVYDANTNAVVNGATVTDTTSGMTATATATPSDPAVDDAFYCVYGPDGANAMNATMALYAADNRTPTVPHYGAVKQDFHLPAGLLSASPTSLTYNIMVGHTGSQTYDLSNVGGAPLNYELKEAPGHLGPAKGDLFASKQGGTRSHLPATILPRPAKAIGQPSNRRVVLDLSKMTPEEQKERAEKEAATVVLDNKVEAPHDPWPPSGPIQLYVDDNSADNSIGINDSTSSYQFIWANRFTPNPGDFPFSLDQISVVLASGYAPVGGALELGVWADTDGDGDPSNATLLATFPVTVVVADGATWNNYALSSPVACTGPGDVIVGIINRYTVSGVDPVSYPASVDETASQGRSWVGWWNTDPPEPPILPPDATWDTIDNLGLPGNWLLRASGQAGDVPWLDENPKTGTLAAGGTQTITVDYDATGLTPGDYLATIQASQDTPYPPANVHVTLSVWPELVVTAGAAPVTGVTPLAVAFTGSATGGDGGPYTYDWNFSDGSPHSTLQNPGHTYNFGGDYTVTLTVTDSHGNTASDSHLLIHVIQSSVPVVYNLYDDAGRAKACVNRITGAFTWMFPAGAPTTTWTGTAKVTNGGAKFTNYAGAPVILNITVDPVRHKATGYAISGGVYSQLNDSNTTNNPPGCF
jgi:hypothetical protein